MQKTPFFSNNFANFIIFLSNNVSAEAFVKLNHNKKRNYTWNELWILLLVYLIERKVHLKIENVENDWSIPLENRG